MNTIISILQRMFSLLVVFLMLVAATYSAGHIFGHDWKGDRVEENYSGTAAVPLPDSLQKVELGIPDAVLQVRDSISWNVIAPDGKSEGVVLSSAFIGKEVEGFAGRTPVYIFMDSGNKVRKIVTGQNDETPAFLKIAENGIFPAWYGLAPLEVLEKGADAVSGATYSSNSLISNVMRTLAVYNASDLDLHAAPAIGWIKTVAVLLVLALGIIASFKFRGIRWIRLCVLALNVLVTGFWCGQFLSMSIIRGWMVNGFNLLSVLPTFVMLAVALVMPYLGRRNHFCTWVCPYGSLQELVWHIPLKKLKLKPAVSRWMGRIRTSVFVVLMALLWLGWGGSILDYEPFGAFLISAAAPAVMILAGVFVLLAVFIPHPWCRTFCPVGELLHLAETPMFKKKNVLK